MPWHWAQPHAEEFIEGPERQFRALFLLGELTQLVFPVLTTIVYFAHFQKFSKLASLNYQPEKVLNTFHIILTRVINRSHMDIISCKDNRRLIAQPHTLIGKTTCDM